MENEPDEIIFQFLDKLDFRDVAAFCRTSPRIRDLCRKYRPQLRQRFIAGWLKRYSKPEQALVSAAREGKLEVVKALVESGVDPSFRDWQALEMASFNKHHRVSDYLQSLKPEDTQSKWERALRNRDTPTLISLLPQHDTANIFDEVVRTNNSTFIRYLLDRLPKPVILNQLRQYLVGGELYLIQHVIDAGLSRDILIEFLNDGVARAFSLNLPDDIRKLYLAATAGSARNSRDWAIFRVIILSSLGLYQSGVLQYLGIAYQKGDWDLIEFMLEVYSIPEDRVLDYMDLAEAAGDSRVIKAVLGNKKIEKKNPRWMHYFDQYL